MISFTSRPMPADRHNSKVRHSTRKHSWSHSVRTVGDYLVAAKTILTLPFALMYSSARFMIHDTSNHKFDEHFTNSMVAHIMSGTSLSQLRIISPEFRLCNELWSPLYANSMFRLPNWNKRLDGYDPSKGDARWISEVPDRKPDDPVIFYCHGGGYALRMGPPLVNVVATLGKELLAHRVSVLALDYSITPSARYPKQLHEAVAAFEALKPTCNRIIGLGDSCGGNLILAMILTLPVDSFWGCLLASPWTDPGRDPEQMKGENDILEPGCLVDMCRDFVDPEQLKDPLVSMISVPTETWRELLPSRIAHVWGEKECLASMCSEWNNRAEIENWFIEPQGTHDCLLRGPTCAGSTFLFQHLRDWLEISDRKSPSPL